MLDPFSVPLAALLRDTLAANLRCWWRVDQFEELLTEPNYFASAREVDVESVILRYFADDLDLRERRRGFGIHLPNKASQTAHERCGNGADTDGVAEGNGVRAPKTEFAKTL